MAWLPSTTSVAPVAEPVSLAEARAQCSIDDEDTSYDTFLGGLIAAAREHVEAVTGLALVTQTRVLRAGRFADLAALPAAPVQSVSTITYLDAEGDEQTLSAGDYVSSLIGLAPSVRPVAGGQWPVALTAPDAVRVTAVCGYGDADAVPATIVRAILLLVADWFCHREDTVAGTVSHAVSLPHGVAALLTNYRLFR